MRLDQQRHVVDDDRVRRRGRDLAQELLADRRVGDRLEVPCGVSSSANAIAASAGRSSEPSASRMSGPNRSTSCASAGVPGSTTCAGDQVGVDDDRAPPRQHRGDGRLPRPDPAREPHHQHGPEPTRARRPSSPRLERACRSATRALQTRGRAAADSACGACVSPRPHGRSRRGRRCCPTRALRSGATSLCHGGKDMHPFDQTAQRSSSVCSTGSSTLDQVSDDWTAGDGPAPAAGSPHTSSPRGCSRTRRSHRATSSVCSPRCSSSGAGAYASHETVRGSCGACRFRGRRCSRSRTPDTRRPVASGRADAPLRCDR